MRQKLFEKEKEISAEIEKLKNQKIELIFQQVKKEMKNEKLEITSEAIAIMPLLEVLRSSTVTVKDSETDNNVFSTADKKIANDVTKEKSIEVFDSPSNGISEITQK